MTSGLFHHEAPSRPALRYFGGKWRIAPWILDHLPAHRCYVEVFGGGASVLLRKRQSPVEVYNDVADAVVNFFRVARDRSAELLEVLGRTPFALAEYNACRSQDGDEVERARRFFVRSWGGHHGTNGSGRNRGWRRTPDRDVAGQMAAAADGLVAICDRLRHVAIESLDWREVLGRYDREDTCFYLDPPYVRHTRASSAPSDGYGEHELTEDDHAELLKRITRTCGAVVLSGYASTRYDNALVGWRRLERKAKRQTGESATEVLWLSPKCAVEGAST